MTLRALKFVPPSPFFAGPTASSTSTTSAASAARRAAAEGIAAADIGQADPVLFLAGIFLVHLAGTDRPLQQQPGGKLHQAGGEAHALGGIGDGAVAIEQAGVLAALAIKIVGGLLHQAHVFLEYLF